MSSQVECKSYFSMRGFNEDSNNNWPLFYGDKNLMGVKLCNGFTALKQKILEHEAIFRNQVYELHRLYRIQNDMMEDIRRKELCKRQSSIDLSSSSSIGGSQIPAGDAIKWRFQVNSGDPMCSPTSCTKGDDVLASESRPSKVRKKLFGLQLLPPVDDEYLDTKEGCSMSKTISSPANNGCNGGGRIDCGHRRDVSTSESCRTSSMRLADLNEPVIIVEDGIVSSTVDYILGDSSVNREERLGLRNSLNPISQFLDLRNENEPNVHRENSGPNLDHASSVVAKKGRDWLCDSHGIIIGEKWQSNGRSRFVPGGGSVDHLPFTNGFYPGSSSSSGSGSKETWAHHPSSRFSHLGRNIGEEDNVHKPLKDMDLNVEFSSNEEIDDYRNPNSMLPWVISSKPSHWTEELPNEGKRRRLIDINLVCQDDEDEEIVTCSRIYIDLNSDLEELEPTESCFVVPVTDMNEDHHHHHHLLEDHNHEKDESLKSVPVEDEVSVMAAEAIMSLSSSFNRSPDSLLWFADAICTVEKETEFDRSNGLKDGRYSMDEFEIMTLQIEETKEEDYMPTPFFHQVQEIEEESGGGGPTKSVANNRGRRRRGGGGRQRRDFQRDILPGLVSLSRHEITLDIQTLSRLMKKATGQTWRKCGGGGRRRRRRVVVDKALSFNGVSCITTIEASLEGWGGKIARRGPRRQRCSLIINNNNNNNNVPLT